MQNLVYLSILRSFKCRGVRCFIASSWIRRFGHACFFGSAVAWARALKAGAFMIYAEPSAEGFYKRLGAIRIGEGPFVLSPEVILPHLLYVVS